MATTPNRRFRDDIYEQFTRIGKAISSPKRLELLELLCQGERTVDALARAASLSVANASQHLKRLQSARLVDAEKSGSFVIYRVADESVFAFARAIRVLAEHRLAEIEQITRQFLEDKEGMEGVDRLALLERVRSGEAIVLDVRPPEEFRAGHIEGALSIPLKELEKHLPALSKDKEIVAYCRGPYCVMSIEAVQMLRARGFRAARLEDDVYEWGLHGLPVAKGDQRQG
ncbi:MAG: metalloregulator ArsR/SmtB family transcription factor [Mariprofundaceae bacterium]